MLWQRYPLFRIFLVFCTGILLTNFYKIPVAFVQVFTVVTFLIFVVFSINLFFFKHQTRFVFGISVLLLCFSLGAWCSQLYQRQDQVPKINSFTNHGIYRLQLTQSPIDKVYAFRTEAKVSRLDSSVKLHTKALLYFQKDTLNPSIPAFGDVYIFTGSLKTLQAPQNPYEFDYKNYLNLRSVYLNGYVGLENRVLQTSDSTSFMARVTAYRAKLLAHIDAWNLPPKQTQISKALLLGYRNDVDADLLKAYSAVGAMHVLAVSGLHIGIVYLVLEKLLFFLRRKREKILKSLLLIFALWVYACLTGLSPSVVRASTMFTFVALGLAFKRNTSIYNTLLVSALFLLFIKPTYLFEVGFQLSYLAVFGIVWLQPKFQKLINPPTWILRQIWAITTVSIAAQIATFPLGLYYFHQFPGLFLVSNLIVIPLITVLMYVGLLLLFISVVFQPIAWLVSVYSWFLGLMNAGVAGVERWDIFLFEQIHISRLELVLFYLLIGFTFHYLFTKNYRWLVLSFSIAISLQLFQIWENYTLANTNELTVYRIKNQDAIAFRQGHQMYFLADTALLHNDGKLTFHAKHHWWASNAKQVHYLNFDTLFNSKNVYATPQYWQLGNLKVAKNPANQSLADVWLVTEPLETQGETTPSKGIILGSNLYDADVEEWKTWASLHKVKVIDPKRDGAWQMRWAIK